MTTDNPLLQGAFNTPYEVPPFTEININHYEPAIRESIEQARQEIAAICENPEEPTFENTIVALERAGEDLERVLGVFGPMLSAMSTPELMEISLKVQPLLSDYYTSVSLNEDLWKRVKSVYETTNPDDAEPIDYRLLKRTYDSFRRNGALLPEEYRAEFKQVQSRLGECTTLFGQNVLKELNCITIELKADEVTELPSHVKEEGRALAKEAEKSDDTYLFTLQQPTYMALMKYLPSRKRREEVYRRYTSRNIAGDYSNIPLVREIVELRGRLAELLGYRTVSDFILENTMAHNSEAVNKLLEQLRSAYKEAAHVEISELTAYAREMTGDETLELMPWDYSYWFNRLRKARFDFDEQTLRPYFELSRVIDGVLGLATRLYGLQFKENTTLPRYHEDVRVYEVRDSEDNFIGILYTDFFPRDTKQPGAWMTEFKGQWQNADGTDSRPVISIVMNFTKPTSSEPSLLTPNEVRTFLHEFGHALHGLLSKVKYGSMSGTNVYRDFVELPSQFNENFLTEREFLNSFARHYKTGEVIPDSEVDKIIASGQFGAAYACYRQLGFGLLDMAYHTLQREEVEEALKDIEAFENGAIESVQLFPTVKKSMISPQFSHIFAGGYASGYYSYKWSEVLDADAFAVFRREGVFNPATAKRFREEILERGSSDEPDRLYHNFKGSKPEIDALLIRDGIIKE